MEHARSRVPIITSPRAPGKSNRDIPCKLGMWTIPGCKSCHGIDGLNGKGPASLLIRIHCCVMALVQKHHQNTFRASHR